MWKHLNLQELGGTILQELVEKIVVHEKVKVDGKKHQQIDIYYNKKSERSLPQVQVSIYVFLYPFR